MDEPVPCRASSPPAISRQTLTAGAAPAGPSRWILSSSEPPLDERLSQVGLPLVVARVEHGHDVRVLTRSAALASRSKRLRNTGSLLRSRLHELERDLPAVSWTARYTRPMPPSPSRQTIR